jgi:hypothetical protein
MSTVKNQDKFKLIADQNHMLRHELRNRMTMMLFLRDSIREQIEARKANSQGASWDHFEHGQSYAKNPQNIVKSLVLVLAFPSLQGVGTFASLRGPVEPNQAISVLIKRML